jgi:stearoyl-CoA desaturase (delta-9 desaturase)
MLIDAWMRSRTNQEHNALAKDVAADPYYRWLSRKPSYALMMLVHFAVPASLAWHWWRVAGLAWFWLTVTVLYNLGDAIDSVSHILGDKLPGQADESRNSWLMGLLVLGEGWHANHHQFPRSARHGLFPGQFDWTWQVIRVLRLLGLATDIYLPSEREILNRPKA